MSLTAGSLCSGYGGLSMAVENFFGAETKWFSEFEKAPSKILEQRWPGVPNHGDMTAIDWAAVEPVDIIEGGTPCQDLSAAGRRRGMTEGTRSNLWVQMREAVATIRPSLVIWENVRGAYSARADSAVESEPGLLGGFGDGRPALRALGRVLGDFSELGYDTEWVGVRASDAGAPHGRYRLFVVAYARGFQPERRRGHGVLAGAPGTGQGRTEERERFWDAAFDSGATAPNTSRIGSGEGNAETERGTESQDRTGVAIERGPDHHGTNWGEYELAVSRWSQTIGRPAPAPRAEDRINTEFVEWMMGLPRGWVTDPCIGLSWNEQLKALGNGVVPQQAELALSIAWERIREEVAA